MHLLSFAGRAGNPVFALAAYNMGVVLAQKGQMQDAAAAFRTAIRLRPGSAQRILASAWFSKHPVIPPPTKNLRTAQM
jgi:hypothetical protein